MFVGASSEDVNRFEGAADAMAIGGLGDVLS
jgi:hypothetical protein